MTVVESASAARRLSAARRFVDGLARDAPVLVVSASRGAADDFAREVARTRGASFGLYRFSLTQLAARFAAPSLASNRLSPTTGLGVQAVAARAAFDAWHDGRLSYFAPVALTPGFPRALARTLEELALASVAASRLQGLPGGGADIAGLLERFDALFDAASTVDRARFFRAASLAARGASRPFPGCRVLLLDVPVMNGTEGEFIAALCAGAPEAFATIPAGDAAARDGFGRIGKVTTLDGGDDNRLDRVRRHLFSTITPPPADPIDAVELFSAPGEGREAVEIARRILREAARGVPFDRMAIAVRTPQHYAGLIEHALRRAGVPAYFDRGSRRPHPAGRAFLALLACAGDNLSARRFAEYLSLGQVPDGAASEVAADTFPASTDDVFGRLAERAQPRPDDAESGADRAGEDGPARRALRAPWKWERLIAESKVIAGEARWSRRLDGLAAEGELQRARLEQTDPDSPRLVQLGQRREDLEHLRRFALPIVATLASWPATATWADWLTRFEALAPHVLRTPDHVLRVLADLRPMGAIGPVGLEEAAQVLANRLASIEAEPPARRYGRVFVASPSDLRGRSFDVVFVPALAERLFPQKPREDPLLLDDARAGVDGGRLVTQTERAELEKLQLRLAVGAAGSRLYLSFPTIEIGEGRPRVPSLYALEVWRAMTGRVPSADELQQAAARASQATLAWPAPADRDAAIDPLEHDLATLRQLVAEPDHRARGRAHYILQLNACLQRSVRERYMRGKSAWSHWDGITRTTPATLSILERQRLTSRTYSLSALQKYASCPYQFLLGAIYRLQPAEDLDPVQRLDPLTRGSLFHAIQAAFYREVKATGRLPVTEATSAHALATLDDVTARVAREYYEQLAPAIDRVWHDEIATIRRDLRLWIDQIARAGGEWVPLWFEWSFGLTDEGRDPASRRDPVTIDGRYSLRGSIDLVEERAGTGELRVTDHKTGRFRGKDRMVVDGGRALQPVLYSLALEAATGRAVTEGRLYYATSDGGFRDVVITLGDVARRLGVEVLEIIDRAVETGFLAPAPGEKACAWCDFRPVCGPTAERRASGKARDALADLLELRRKP